MSVRYLKKVLKEQEAAAALQEQLKSDDDDTESPESPTVSRNPFDLLEADNDCDDDDHQNGSDQENDDNAGETPDTFIQHSSNVKVAVSTNKVSINVKSKKKKKKKVRESFSKSTGNDASSSRLALENLTLEASSSSSPQVDDLPAQQKTINLNGSDMMKKQHRSSTLEVDPKFLNAESEMRRIFGSKVVNSYERSRASTNPRQQIRGGRRAGHSLKKTILVSPSEHWPRWDGSLSMELLDTTDNVHYFKYVHSSSYAQAQRGFEAAKAIHDFNGIASILLHNPYHIDSLITLADYFKFTGEHEMSADATSKCLYALECAWHPQFTPSLNCQLKYVHDENKPFFTSLFTHMKNMDRRGCHRSALEICKMLLSLDSDDPMGAKLCIDYYALRAEEYSWLERFAEEHGNNNSLWLFPNFSFSLAISRFYLERKDDDTGKAAASELMKQALMLHPHVLRKLVDKVPLKERVWGGILNHSFFKNDETGSPSLDHLISIYVERSYLIWRLPDLQKLLSDSALDMLEKQVNEAKDWACVRKEAFSSEKNEYSHLLVSEFSDAMPTMPPENLQDFMVDPRGGGLMNGQEFVQAPEEHLIHDVANRNPLAVLFESMLPWMNFGSRDGEETQHADED